jgi:serine/threonine protein kinase
MQPCKMPHHIGKIDSTNILRSDVVGDQNEVEVSVYDHSPEEAFLGHVRFCPTLLEGRALDTWFKLEPREESDEHVTGEIRLRVKFQKTDKKTYGPEDFQILKLIGKGTFGQVFQVRKRDTQRIYAMKVLSKKVIVQKKEVAHTLGERNILVRTAMADSTFIVGLKFSFQTPSDLYLVTDYMSGGELFWHLQKEGRFTEERAKFYIAELVLALEHLHNHDIVYRDLKPENILLDANGHIALCDFGLSKANLTKDETTNTFCGTTEYLAPEVLLDEHGYTKLVDFWSLGVLIFEMCCGWSPFYAEDTQQMYKNIAFGKVRFPRDALSNEGRNLVKGLLNRNPRHRLGANGDAAELKAHEFFHDVDWVALARKNLVPPFKPKLKSELDVSNFDPEFTNALNDGAGSLNTRAAAIASGIDINATPLSPTMQANFQGFTFVDESAVEKQFEGRNDPDSRMDGNDDDDWDVVGSGDRMTGVQQTSSGRDEDEMFSMGA